MSNMDKEYSWQTIESVPKDGTKIDLWCKAWKAQEDKFIFRRMPDCYWFNSSVRGPEWSGFDTKYWCPTHWMPISKGPNCINGDSRDE